MKEQTKGKIKGIISGVIIGATIVGTVGYAAVQRETLNDVITSGVSIVVDGKKLNPTDVNGNRVEPFIYNGTTYLPVRAVANSMGKAVYWDGPSYTVYLGDMDGKLEYPTVKLEDMTSIAATPITTDSLTDNYENKYQRAITNYWKDGYQNFEYLLNMKYSRFKATLYVPHGTNVCYAPGYLQITADGKTIYTSPEMTTSSRPVEIDVNVTGCNDVEIRFNSSYYRSINMCLGDAGFYQ